MTVQRVRARKQPAQVRREEIIDAAIRLFARSPYAATGTADIAAEAGIAEPTIYRHFGSKRELYLAVVDRSGAVVLDMFRAIAQRPLEPLLALHEMGRRYEDLIATDSDTLRVRQRAIAEADNDEVRALCQRRYREIVEEVAGVFRRGQAQGVFTPDLSAEGMAWLFMSIGQMMDAAILMGLDEGRFCVDFMPELMVACLRGVLADPNTASSLHASFHQE